MKQVIDAIYENGTFESVQSNIIKIAEETHGRITIDDKTEPESLKLTVCVYDRLFKEDIGEIEQIAFNRSNFFGTRSMN